MHKLLSRMNRCRNQQGDPLRLKPFLASKISHKKNKQAFKHALDLTNNCVRVRVRKCEEWCRIKRVSHPISTIILFKMALKC